ncbi:MAG: tRNA pseudouridine(55) synthase TruB [Candidatus Peregrinibacteria bacterium]|nr:tRNA pseudouridine(55) synthase TruB [Candidatus Peregrinibacteria bacterium]
MDGLLLIDKPSGWTSFDVVAKIRNKLGVKKVGHSGTLDPMATGLLILCVGKATKQIQEMIGFDKEYIAEITLGATTNTDDAEGEIKKSDISKLINLDDIETVLEKFRGEIEQVPPQFSAKKIKGQRAYAMARKGQEVKLEPVKITIHELELLNYQWPVLSIRVLSSKGTYIRALARDIGRELGCGAYLSALERTKIGPYNLSQAQQIADVTPEAPRFL